MSRGRTALAMIAVALCVATPALAADTPRTHFVVRVDDVVRFDKTLAASLQTDAGLNVLMAAQAAAMAAGASEVGILTDMTVTHGSPVTVDIDTQSMDDQSGPDASDVVQAGSAASGDAIGGQVVSVTGGSSVVHQTNTSTNVRARTGSSTGGSG